MKLCFTPVRLLTLAASLWTAAAHAQTVITSLPYTISAPGLYVLNRNLSSTPTEGNLITVDSSNVTTDFQGHYIAGPSGDTNQSFIGVDVLEKSNVTIKNGTVAFCSTGIYLGGNNQANTNAVGAVVDNMRVTYCFRYGIATQYCPASRVTNCQVSQTGYSGAGYAYGIYTTGPGVTVQNNAVCTVTATNGYGIYAPDGFARQNTISLAKFGVVFAKYQDNLTYGCATPCGGGIDAGGNN